MASAKDRVSRKRKQPRSASKIHLVLDVMQVGDEIRNKIDLSLQEFLLQYEESTRTVIVISQEQLEQYKKLSIQRIQHKIEWEDQQHKQKMNHLQDFN